jgi:predicted nucleotidyltransferase
LEKLFDSPAKLRLLKLFLRNPEERFTLPEMRKRTMLDSGAISRQLQKLHDIRFISATKKRGSSNKVFGLNTDFVFFEELQNLILKSSPADEDKIAKKIRNLGKIRLAILSGIFLKSERENARADLLIVADAISERKLANFIRTLEAEAGVELHYTILSADEFSYRHKMFDRFLRDILEKPHKVLIGRLAPR